MILFLFKYWGKRARETALLKYITLWVWTLGWTDLFLARELKNVYFHCPFFIPVKEGGESEIVSKGELTDFSYPLHSNKLLPSQSSFFSNIYLDLFSFSFVPFLRTQGTRNNTFQRKLQFHGDKTPLKLVTFFFLLQSRRKRWGLILASSHHQNIRQFGGDFCFGEHVLF